MTANKNRYIGGAKRTSNPHPEQLEKAEIVLVSPTLNIICLLGRGQETNKEVQDGCSIVVHVGNAGKQ